MPARLTLLLLLTLPTLAADLTPDTTFPNAAAEITHIDQRNRIISFKIPAAPNGGWQTWWSLKITHITPGETLHLKLLNGQSPATRAAYSTDHGKTWRFTEPAAVENTKPPTRTYSQKIDAEQAHFAWYVPYTNDDAKTLADRAAKLPFVKKFDLARSEAGLGVTALRFDDPDSRAPDKPHVWVQARQHAWEVGGSWTAHGLAEFLLSDDDRAKNLRRRAIITVVPIIDVDSVQAGRGGKDQKPHDHNRDWSDTPRWNAVQAAMRELKALDANRQLALFLDLHDPGWTGSVEFWCHTYPTMSPTRRHNTDLFLAAAKTELTSPLPFNGKPTATYPLNTPTSGIWATRQTREPVTGGTFEIGIAPRTGFDFTQPPPTPHLTCGQQLARAIERYLTTPTRKTN